MRIVCPAGSDRLYGAGNWKDLKAFKALLCGLGVESETIAFETSKPERAFDVDYEGVTDIVVQYSFWPELLTAARRAAPRANLHVRTINAEAFQHWQRADVRWSLEYENLRAIYGAMRLAYRDSQCRQRADYLLGISEWDNQHYWRRLPGRGRVVDVPYHCPWPGLRPNVRPLPWHARRNAVVCLPGGRDRIGRGQLDGMVKLAAFAKSRADFGDWTFEVSRGILKSEGCSSLLGPVLLMADLAEPWDLLCSVKALAILTPLGFGTKTTIVDALAAGCHVIVDKTLASRLSERVRAKCQVIDVESEADVNRALSRIGAEPEANDLNERIVETARLGLAQCLGIGGTA